MKKKRKKTIKRILVSPLWAGLLLLGGLAPPFATQAEVANGFALRISNGLASLSAEHVSLQQIIEEVVVQADLRLIQHGSIEGAVTVTLPKQPLDEFLNELLKDQSYQLFQAAVDADEANSLGPVPGTLWIFSSGQAPAPAATVFLEAVLYFGSVAEKKEAIRELRRLGSDVAVETLSLALQDADKRIRDAALDALAAIAATGSDAALAAIASTSFDNDLRARDEAVNAMSSGNAASALRYLDLAMADPDPRVRMSVIDAYADIPDEYAAMAISRALADPDPDVREHALNALDEVKATTAFDALMKMRN